MADKLPLCAIGHSCTDVDRNVAGVDAQNYIFKILILHGALLVENQHD